jgi:hypothetical protein
MLSQEREFQYGAQDCCLFVCDAILAMTDVDIAAAFRGNYASRREAYAFIKARAGLTSVAAITERITRKYEMPEIPLAAARRGDVVLLCRDSLALIGLNGDILAPVDLGLERVPRDLMMRSWRV